MIRTRALGVHLSGRDILADAQVEFAEGAVTAVVGPNGAGKTTLLRALYRELQPSSGEVIIDDTALAELARREVARRIAVVAQDSESGLPMTVRQVVTLGRLARRSLLGFGDAADRELAEAALDRVGMAELADREFPTLSGGERQRVLIARAIVQDTDHLLLDEPTNHLDLRHQFGLLDLIQRLGKTTAIVLHDLNLAARCDRVILLDGGRLVAEGTPDQVFVPELIAAVYGVGVQRIDRPDGLHLVFAPPAPGS